uniref:Uncharacterized protein n=1 Tax=Oryza punctata TaxID=4537 RepID=A0A0E0M9R1_ORYPU
MQSQDDRVQATDPGGRGLDEDVRVSGELEFGHIQGRRGPNPEGRRGQEEGGLNEDTRIRMHGGQCRHRRHHLPPLLLTLVGTVFFAGSQLPPSGPAMCQIRWVGCPEATNPAPQTPTTATGGAQAGGATSGGHGLSAVSIDR